MKKRRVWIFVLVIAMLFTMTTPIFAAMDGAEMLSGTGDPLKDAIVVDSAEKMAEINAKSEYKTEKVETEKSPDWDKINEFINDKSFDTKVQAADKYEYVNRVNGATQIDEKSIQSEIITTEPKEAEVTAFFTRSKTSNVFSGLGEEANLDYIYPGNILAIANDNILNGKYDNTTFNRSGGVITMDQGKPDFKIEIDDMSAKAKPGWDIEDAMYDNLNNAYYRYIIRVASATSPEQLAASLGVTIGEVDQMINPDEWDLIRKGKKQVTAASVVQVVCSLTFANDLEHPADLFSKDTTLTDVKKLGDRSMLIRKVNYGRKFLVTAGLNLLCSPNEERTELTDAVTTLFRGAQPTEEGRLNAIHYADVNVHEIGVTNNKWTVPQWTGGKIKTITEFIKYLSEVKEYINDEDHQYLVPVSYEASLMGGQMNNVELNIDAKEYNYFGKAAQRIKGVTFVDDAQNKNKARWFNAYGLDIDAFNQNHELKSKTYNIASGDKTGIVIPAYQNLYGLEFDLKAGDSGWILADCGEVRIASDGRLYNGFGMKITDDEGDYIEARRAYFDNAKFYLTYENRKRGTDRNRVDSSLKNRLDIDTNGNPLYTEAASHGGTGWGDAWSSLTYEKKYELAGNNLFLNNEYNGQSNGEEGGFGGAVGGDMEGIAMPEDNGVDEDLGLWLSCLALLFGLSVVLVLKDKK